jgi:hypothetical protein
VQKEQGDQKMQKRTAKKKKGGEKTKQWRKTTE